jgi:hypothetical protein
MITKTDMGDYTGAMRSRLVNFMHKISVGERKERPPSWTRKLPWNAVGCDATSDIQGSEDDGAGAGGIGLVGHIMQPSESKGAAAKARAAKVEKQPQCFFGFGTELFLAFRCKKVGGVKDVSLPIVVDPRSKPHDPIVAKWGDGTEHVIAMMTVAQFKVLEAGRKPQSDVGSGPLYVTEHKGTHNRLKIEQRVDRSLLISCYEQSSHIGCVKAERFGPLPPQFIQPCRVPSDTEAVANATTWLRHFVDKHAHEDTVAPPL